MSNSLWPHRLQHARLPCPSPSPRACSNSCPLSWWSIQLSHPLSSPSPPPFNLSQHQGLFQWVSPSHQVAKVLELQLQYQSFQWMFRVDLLLNWLIWSCSPRDSQESSPAAQLERLINSLALSLLYGPTLTAVLDYWKNQISIVSSMWTFSKHNFPDVEHLAKVNIIWNDVGLILMSLSEGHIVKN